MRDTVPVLLQELVATPARINVKDVEVVDLTGCYCDLGTTCVVEQGGDPAGSDVAS